MNLMPIMVRELRAQSRQESTYWFRWLSVLPLGLLAWFWALRDPEWLRDGPRLIQVFQCGLLAAIWLLVPAMVGDLISRERREGTLALLFLTPLRPSDLILAKGFASVTRAGMLLAAALPLLVLPFLLGGVDLHQAVLVLTVLACSFLLAVACGLAGSSRHDRMQGSFLLAYGLALICLLLLFGWLGLLMTGWSGWPAGLQSLRYFLANRLAVGWLSFLDFGDMQLLLRRGRAGPGSMAWFWVGLLQMAGLTVLLTSGLMVWSGRNIRSYLLDLPRSRFQTGMRNLWVKPRLGASLLRAWMRHALSTNPMGWLEMRSWQARSVSWGWLGILTLIYSGLLTNSRYLQMQLYEIQMAVGYGFMFCLAMTSAASFRRERDSGVLELLLVTPLSAQSLVGGRLRSIWIQFLPALVMYLAVWFYIGSWNGGFEFFPRNLSQRYYFGGMIQVVASYIAFPVFGLYWSLRVRRFLTALVLTLATQVVLVILKHLTLYLWVAYGVLISQSADAVLLHLFFVVGVPLLWMGAAGYFGNSLMEHLQRRRFVLRLD